MKSKQGSGTDVFGKLIELSSKGFVGKLSAGLGLVLARDKKGKGTRAFQRAVLVVAGLPFAWIFCTLRKLKGTA